MKLDLKSLIEQVNIVDLIADFSSLTKAGSSYKTLCNVHGDRSPSLSINPRKQIYKCFVCNHGGNALDYLIWAQKFTFNEAVAYLAKLTGQDLNQYFSQEVKPIYNEKQQELIDCLNDASNLFKYYLDLYKHNPKIRTFLHQRRLSTDEIIKYGLGYAPNETEENYLPQITKKEHTLATLINASIISETYQKLIFTNRIIFPIFDETNHVVAWSGRALEEEQQPKYLHSRESLVFQKSQLLYNYQNAKKYDALILVEGFMDVIAFNKIGYDNAIALMGLSLSLNQINKLKKHKTIYLCLDQDQAGISAAITIIAQLMKHQIEGFVLNLTGGKDADEVINGPDGQNRLKAAFTKPQPFINFVYENLKAQCNKNDPEEIKHLLNKLNAFSIHLDDISFDKLVNQLVLDLELATETIKKVLQKKENVVQFTDYNASRAPNQNQSLTNVNKGNQTELVNINKLLLTLFTNPSYLQFNYIEQINWFLPKYQKIYQEIKAFYDQKEDLSVTSQQHLQWLQSKYGNSWVIPKTESELRELIDRISVDDSYAHIKQFSTQLISSNQASEKDKINVLEVKQKLGKKIE